MRTGILLIVLITFNSLYANDTQHTVQVNKKERVFVIHAPINNLGEFRELAEQAARLKPFGRVEINVSNLADKGFHEIPQGRNYWYEYASYNPTPYKFFPDPKIAPFIPADFVNKNRELLLEKANILREFGLGGAFWSYEPNFLPEEFFDKYPHMLGARVDHPRRGNRPAFAPCISVEETREMFANMVEELLKNVPEINTFFFKTNDAGSGICWSDWQYAGPNGPSHCKHHSMGERVEMLMNSFQQGAERSGEDISIYLTGSMFSDEEKNDIYAHLPEGCYFQSHNSDEVHGINSMIVGNYPVRGLFNPLEIIQNINSINTESTNRIFISFRASYDRAFEDMGTMVRFLDLLIEIIDNNVGYGVVTEEQILQKLCLKWGIDANDHLLYQAFTILDEAEKFRNISLRETSGMYWGVSTRHITRPLVIAPQLLTPDEESYFLPHVFNPSEEEARMDYTDIHGDHRSLTSGAANKYVLQLKKVISILEKACETAPEKAFLQNMTKALKIHGSIFRSIGNFAEAQMIRDRNTEKLSVDPHRPTKTPTWEGDPDLQAFMTIMRDELDNAQELIDVLEDGGMKFIAYADDSKYEDTFLLGPDLIDQLKLKRRIMLRHWTDIEGYMATPFK